VVAITDPDEMRQTKPGTPGGELLRRSWHPIAAVGQLTSERPIRPVRVLSEGLVLYRDRSGRIGLVQERCTHHGVLLAYGRVNHEALICPYHEWHFDAEGNCWAQISNERRWEMPWSKAAAYPVSEYGGLLWTYLGQDPAPPLPPHHFLDKSSAALRITIHPAIEANLAMLEAPPNDGRLWLRTPIDDTHVWQVTIERIRGDGAAEPELVYLDEADADPLHRLAPSPFR